MKSVRISLIVLFSLFIVSLNGQVFTGGNISLHTNGGSQNDGTTTTDKTSNFNFGLSPKVGIFLSEKVAAGVAFDFEYSRSKIPGNTEIISKSSTFGFTPFLRYYAVKVNKFSIFGQGNIGMSFSNSNSKIGGISNDGPKITRVYLSIYPGLAYDLSDKLSLETSLNFLSLSYNNVTSKNGSDTDKTSTFNFGTGLDNIITVGNITVGAIYKF